MSTRILNVSLHELSKGGSMATFAKLSLVFQSGNIDVTLMIDFLFSIWRLAIYVSYMIVLVCDNDNTDLLFSIWRLAIYVSYMIVLVCDNDNTDLLVCVSVHSTCSFSRLP